MTTYRAKAAGCASCSLETRCTTSKNGRQVRRSPGERYVDRVRGYWETEPYRKAMRRRRGWVEPLLAEAKGWHGMRRFRLRTSWRANVEALLVAAGQNLKRLPDFGELRPEDPAQAVTLTHHWVPNNVALRFRRHRTQRVLARRCPFCNRQGRFRKGANPTLSCRYGIGSRRSSKRDLRASSCGDRHAFREFLGPIRGALDSTKVER